MIEISVTSSLHSFHFNYKMHSSVVQRMEQKRDKENIITSLHKTYIHKVCIAINTNTKKISCFCTEQRKAYRTETYIY